MAIASARRWLLLLCLAAVCWCGLLCSGGSGSNSGSGGCGVAAAAASDGDRSAAGKARGNGNGSGSGSGGEHAAWLGGGDVGVSGNGELPHEERPRRNGTIKALVVVARHGDRAPQNHAPAYAAGTRQEFFKPFPFDSTEWDVDYGQLTGLGMRQCFNFGAYLRSTYVTGAPEDRLLKEHYDHEATHVRATDVDRTLVSAAAVMHGLYPEKTGPEIGPVDPDSRNLPKYGMPNGVQLVPVHTRLYNDDRLLDGSSKGRCPRWDVHASYALKSDEVYGFIMQQRSLLDALPRLTAYSEDEVAALSPKQLVGLVAALRDVRLSQRAHNVTVDDALSAFDQTLEDVTARLNSAKWDRSGLGYLVGGRLLRSIATRIETAMQGDNGAQDVLDMVKNECNQKGHDGDEDGNCLRKFIYYSGHDTTVFDVRSALGLPVIVEGVVPYLSHVMFELRRVGRDHDDFEVSVLAGHYAKEPAPIAGPYCNGRATCPAAQFLQWVRETVPANVSAACGLDSEAARDSGSRSSWWRWLFGRRDRSSSSSSLASSPMSLASSPLSPWADDASDPKFATELAEQRRATAATVSPTPTTASNHTASSDPPAQAAPRSCGARSAGALLGAATMGALIAGTLTYTLCRRAARAPARRDYYRIP